MLVQAVMHVVMFVQTMMQVMGDVSMIVHMFAQQFYTLEKFSNFECIEQWRVTCHQYCYDA